MAHDIEPVTREEAMRLLLEADDWVDREAAHIQADRALCGLLLSLGFDDIVEVFERVDKWYA